MPKLWNNTQTLDLLKWKYFTHIYKSASCHILSLKYVFYMLHDPLLWSDSFMLSKLLLVSSYLFIQNIKNIILTWLPFPLLHALLSPNYLKFAKTKYFHWKFDWLTKLTHTTDRGVYLKRLIEYSIFLPCFYLSKIEI